MSVDDLIAALAELDAPNGPLSPPPVVAHSLDGIGFVAVAGAHAFEVPRRAGQRAWVAFILDDRHGRSLGPKGLDRRSLAALLRATDCVVFLVDPPEDCPVFTTVFEVARQQINLVLCVTGMDEEAQWRRVVKEHAPDALMLPETGDEGPGGPVVLH